MNIGSAFGAAVLQVVFAILSVRVHAFWARVGQGITILRDRRRYAREMVTWQLGAWAFRFVGPSFEPFPDVGPRLLTAHTGGTTCPRA